MLSDATAWHAPRPSARDDPTFHDADGSLGPVADSGDVGRLSDGARLVENNPQARPRTTPEHPGSLAPLPS